jgi:hypothetical protein
MMGLSNTWAMNGIANTYDTITVHFHSGFSCNDNACDLFK